MRRYLVVLMVIAFVVGSLFRATEQTGMRIWNMFATMGIFLFGLIGSLALARMQRRAGIGRVETVLKRLEPAWVITDWFGEDDGKPDYLLVGPAGIIAVCVDETAGSSFRWRARRAIEASCRRAERSAVWVRDRLRAQEGRPDSPGEPEDETPVRPVVLLTRRGPDQAYSAGGVPVVNPGRLPEYLRSDGPAVMLDQTNRFRLTRILREADGSHGKVVSEGL